MENETLVYVDGCWVAKSEAKISVFDHGLLYGDGVFEGIRAYNGCVFLLAEHIERLYESAGFIELRIPHTPAEMTAAVLETLRRNGLSEAYIRIVITRGVGDFGVNPKLCRDASVIVITQPMTPDARTEPREWSGLVTSVRRDAVDATTHECKSLNYMNTILAVLEANRLGADVAIMLDSRGFVSEGPTLNLFMVKKGVIYTPGPSSGILHGITRARMMRLATELGFPLVEKDITPFELAVADEIFLTGTLYELVSIIRLNTKVVGEGVTGPVTRALYKEFGALVRGGKEGARIFA